MKRRSDQVGEDNIIIMIGKIGREGIGKMQQKSIFYVILSVQDIKLSRFSDENHLKWLYYLRTKMNIKCINFYI